MTFNNILLDVYRRCGFSTTPDAAVITRIKAFVNETQQEILHEPGMEFLQNATITFASVADQQTYGLPPSVARIKVMRDATTNRIILPGMSLGEYRERYPGPAAVTGTPTRYVDLGFDAISVEPSDASGIYVVSSSASDVGTAFIEGVRSGGYQFIDQVTMTGVTAVTFPDYTDVVDITKFYISAAAAGTVTLREDSGTGTTLATIAVGRLYSRYRRIALAPTPAAAITYSLDYERDVADLVENTDEPIIPYSFHHILATGARMKEYEKTSDSRWELAQREYEKALKKLKFALYEQAVGTPNLRGTFVSRPSIMDGGTAATGGTTTPTAVTDGGTGFSSYTVGDLLTADTTATLAKLLDVATGQVLRSGGVGVIPAYGQVVLTTDVSGDLPLANLAQGTALSVLGVTGNATADEASIVAASDFQVLRRSGTAVAFGAVDISQAAALTGTLPTARAGSGTASVETFLRGDQSWAAAFPQITQGRLTLTTAVPVTVTDVSAVTNIFFTPYGGNRIAIYNGTNWRLYTFTELTLALGTLTNALPHDVFIYDNAGTLTLELLAWTNDTTRATALVLQDGVLVKSGVTTRKYLGTFRTTSTTTTEDTLIKRHLWNYYNRVPRIMRVTDSTDTWSYSTATIRQSNANAANQLDFVVGVAEVMADVTCRSAAASTSLGDNVSTGIGYDDTTTYTAGQLMGRVYVQVANQNIAVEAHLKHYPAVGRHTYSWNERAGTVGTMTWHGDNGAPTVDQAGIHGTIDG